jgi:tetratricopeptide (TPR) repeat protein
MKHKRNAEKHAAAAKESPQQWPIEPVVISLQASEAYFNRGRIKQDKGDIEGAIADFDKAIEINPLFAAAYYERGRAKHANWDYEDAIADYTKAIEINPEFNEAYYQRGLARNLIFDDEGAMDDLAIVSLDAPKDDKAFLEYSFKAALEVYDTYIECNPIEDIDRRDAKACRDLAKVYCRRGQHRTLVWNDSDIDDYSMAIEADPRYAEAYYLRGMANDNYQDYHSAINDYTKAVEINPRFADAYFHRGAAKNRVSDPNAAKADRAKASELDPRYARPSYDDLFRTVIETAHDGPKDPTGEH